MHCYILYEVSILKEIQQKPTCTYRRFLFVWVYVRVYSKRTYKNFLLEMGFSIHIDVTPPTFLDQPDAWDNVSICILFVYTVLCVISIAAVVHLKSRYDPLKAKDPLKLIASLVFSLIHLWSLVISNEQMWTIKQWSHSSCSFWNFWLPYFMGLQPWFIFMIDRTCTYGLVFQADLDLEKVKRHCNTLKIVFYTFLGMPTFVICFLDSMLQMSWFDPTLEQCTSVIPIKICLLVDMVFLISLLIIVNVYVHRDVNGRFFNEYMAQRDVTIQATVCMIVFAFINFTGLSSKSYGRSIQLLCTMWLYLFCFLRLVGYTLLKAYQNDQDFVEEFRDEIELDRKPRSIAELRIHSDMTRDFLQFCEGREMFIMYENDERTKSHVFTPQIYVACIREIENMSLSDGKESVVRLENLVKNYFDDSKRDKGDYVMSRTFIIQHLLSRIQVFKEMSQVTEVNVLQPLLHDLYFTIGCHFLRMYNQVRWKEFVKSKRNTKIDHRRLVQLELIGNPHSSSSSSNSTMIEMEAKSTK